MSKIDQLNDLVSLTNEQSAVQAINQNNSRIEDALDNTLSRDGSGPNAMESDFDMNSHRILNLPEPGTLTEPARLADIIGSVDVNFLNQSTFVTPFMATVLDDTTASAARTTLDASSRTVVNVRDFGATGDGVTDDRASIMAAVAFCKTQGTAINGFKGATLFFPPGSYKVTDQITDGGSAFGIPILGSGLQNTIVWGDVIGFIFNKEGGASFEKGFTGITGLRIANSREAANCGAVKTNETINFYVRDCLIQGHIGVDLCEQTFGNVIENCNFLWHPDDYTSVAAYMGQGRIDGCSVNGYSVGFQLCTSNDGGGAMGIGVRGNRLENCNIAILAGISRQGGQCGVSSTIQDMSTERCDVGLYFRTNGGVVSNVKVTGTVGPPSVGSATWAAGVATVTSNTPLASKPGPGGPGGEPGGNPWTSGTRVVTIDLASNSGYNVSKVTATRTGANTFTYPLAVDPSGSASILAWSFEITAGLIANGNGVSYLNCEFVQKIDLSVNNGPTYFLNTGVNGPGGWVMPIFGSGKNQITFGPGCNAPELSMLFSELPGQPFIARTPFFGDRFFITDGAKSGGGAAAWGDTVQGGGSQKLEVIYNGTIWKAVSLL